MLQSIPPRDYFLEIMTNGQLWSNPCFPGHVITGKTRVKIMVTGSFPRDLLTPTILGTHSLLEVSFPHSFKRTPGRSPLRPAILGAPLPLGSWAVLCHWGCRAWELLPPWGGGAALPAPRTGVCPGPRLLGGRAFHHPWTPEQAQAGAMGAVTSQAGPQSSQNPNQGQYTLKFLVVVNLFLKKVSSWFMV